MANQPIVNIICTDLRFVNNAGIQASRAVLFGSWARGEAHPDSDIELLVIAPEFDGNRERKLVDRLWELRAATRDAWRVEPIPCGERQWLEHDTSPVIEIARREGKIVALVPEAT